MTMNKSTRESCDILADSLGLSKSTVRDLIERGWTFKSDLNAPAVFIDPSHQFHI